MIRLRTLQNRIACLFRADTMAASLVIVVLLAPIATAWHLGDTPIEMAWGRFASSVAVASAASMLAVIVGGLLAALFVLTDFPAKSFWATVALIPFVCPSMVWALGQVYCFGPGGLIERWFGPMWRIGQYGFDSGNYVATTLVLAQIHTPLAMLLVGRGMGRLHLSGFPAARLFLSRFGSVRWIVGAIRQEALAAVLLCLALALGNFAVPHMFQCRLYPMEIYFRAINYLDHAGAIRTALPLLCVSLTAAAIFAMVDRNARHASARQAYASVPIRLGRAVWPLGVVVGVYFMFTTFLPTAAMVYECKSPGLWLAVVRDAAEETENTLRIAASAAFLACLTGTIVGVWAGSRRRLWIDLLTLVPIGLPALLVGLCYVRFYHRTWPLDLTSLGNTSLLVILALVARTWPFVTRSTSAGRRRISDEWLDAARLGGLTGVRRWRWITGPMLIESIAVGGVVAFILAAGEVEICQLLCAPGTGTLALRLFTFLHFGPTHVAAGLAVLQLTIVLIPLWIYFLLTNRYPQVV